MKVTAAPRDASPRSTLSLRLARSHERELLDGEHLDPLELRSNLGELAMLNRLPGGTSASIAAIGRLCPAPRPLTILDVGTGAGDMPLAFARHGRGRGGWRVIAVDSRPEIVELARRRTRGEPLVSVETADARRLPIPDNAVDVAHASLVLHHFEPDAARAVLSEMRRVARLGVVINDLQRGLLHYQMTAATVRALARSRYTRHDGVLSARRAYTLRERDALLEAAGLAECWHSSRLGPRVTTAAIAR